MSECLTTLSLTVFTQRIFVPDFKRSAILHEKRPVLVLRFSAPFGGEGGLGATYDVYLIRLIGKRVVDFLLVLTERFC